MGSLFRLTRDTVTPSAGTRVLKASEAAVLLEANAVLDAARERVADMERKAGEAYERRREEGYRDGVEEGRLEHAEKVMETVLSSVEYIEGIEATLVNVVAVAVRKIQAPADCRLSIILNIIQKDHILILRILIQPGQHKTDPLCDLNHWLNKQADDLQYTASAVASGLIGFSVVNGCG